MATATAKGYTSSLVQGSGSLGVESQQELSERWEYSGWKNNERIFRLQWEGEGMRERNMKG